MLWLSTAAFTLLFAVWLMLGVLGIKIRDELKLTPAQFDWLLAVAILAGSLPRLHFGIWADRYGGRLVMTLTLLFTAVPTFWVSQVTSYEELLACAALFGLAGNSFTVGIAWSSAWFPNRSKGTALGVFGAGNVGASATKFLAPVLLATIPAAGFLGGAIPGGWRFVPVVYAVLLVLMAAAVWFLCPSPDRRPGPRPAAGRGTRPAQARPRVAVQSVLRRRVRGVRCARGVPAEVLRGRVRPLARRPRATSPPCSSSRRACSARWAGGCRTVTARGG